ncbi:MAG: 4Fe-4S binding protein [Rickettsiales bacterium]|jgi:iron-only hydrogenase group A|nr:4Fe-4S binding protein [Rickettsiales bacterium]
MLKLGNSVEFDNSRCIKCGKCAFRCKSNCVGHIDVNVKDKVWNETSNPCIFCGQCTLVCPVNAIREQNSLDDVKKLLQDKTKTIIAQAAPSARTVIGEKKIYSALRKLGFTKVFDVNFGANITTVVEAEELVERLQTPNSVLPMFSSCCPAWVSYVCQYTPELKPHLTTARSPNLHAGFAYKTWWADKVGINPKDIKVVSIMPCTAKKDEIKRENAKLPNGEPVIDYVLTVREFQRMLKENNIEQDELEDGVSDTLGEYTGDANLYGVTGGVTESALRTAYWKLTGKDLDNVEFQQVRPDMNGLKSIEIEVAGKKLKLAVVATVNNFNKLLPTLKEYHYVEVMNCVGGCIGGGGMPLLANKPAEQIQQLEERKNKLFEMDKEKKKRMSHKNEFVIEYMEWLKHREELKHQALHNEF